MGWRSSALGLAAVALLLLGLTAGSGAVWGSFSAQTVNVGNVFSAAPDFVAPLASGAVIQKSTGGTPGYVRSGASYRVFAAVTDTGKPASGIASVVAGVAGGPTNVPLTAGSYTGIGGATYTHRTALQTLGTTPAATYPFTLGTTDVAGNTRAQSGFSVVVDNTAPTPVDVGTTNHSGGIAGRPEAADTMTLTYSEPIDSISADAGWAGTAPIAVVAYLTNGTNGSNDAVSLYDAASSNLLPLGTIDLGRTDYTTASRSFGQTGTASTMAVSGNSLVVTFGTASGAATTAASTGALRWAITSGPTDRAGNALAASTFAVPGAAAREF